MAEATGKAWMTSPIEPGLMKRRRSGLWWEFLLTVWPGRESAPFLKTGGEFFGESSGQDSGLGTSEVVFHPA